MLEVYAEAYKVRWRWYTSFKFSDHGYVTYVYWSL